MVPRADATIRQQCGVEAARLGLRRDFAEESPTEDATDVRIGEGLRGAVREARHRRGGVAADPGQRVERRRVWGQAAGTEARDAMQVARAPVVAEARPFSEHVRKRRLGETPERREATEEALVHVQYARHLRLLEHDLRDEDGVWVAGAAPGEDAAVARVPADEGRREAHRASLPFGLVDCAPVAPLSPIPAPRAAFPAAILLAIAIVFFLQALQIPDVGSLLFVGLGIAFATPYVFSTDRRRHMYLLPAGTLLGLGVGLWVPDLLDAPSSIAAPIFLTSLAAGLVAVVLLARERPWPLLLAAVLFVLAVIEIFAHRLFIPEPIRPFIVPAIIFALGIYVLVDRGTNLR